MNVAGLELCKKLYELSGWQAELGLFYRTWHSKANRGERRPSVVWCGDVHVDDETIPAYDAGFLLRKLPRYDISFDGILHTATFWDANTDQQIFSEGKTVENALAKLAIQLVKQGVLVREGAS